MRKKANNRKIKNWIVISISALVLLVSFYIIYKKPITYYTRLAYHKIISFKKLKQVPVSNKTTNLYTHVYVPDGEVYGIDISRHQGVINWSVLSNFKFRYHKIDFIYIKATESDNWIDNRYDINWINSKKHGFIRGAYHFFDPNTKSSTQMENFFKNVKLEKGDLPPMLDVEEESLLNVQEYRNKVLQCLKLMESHYKMKPILYTNQSFYNQYFRAQEFAGYSLWLSRLLKSPPKQQNWVIWQFSHSSTVPGIDEYVDFNIFNGSLNKFKIIQKK
ncbi:MAG: glycoside hydrolase family 25 protein [Bacteroidales bacterium]|nr:glycoside hydrolase family 25 protein [Bacteroidales bacterium]